MDTQNPSASTPPYGQDTGTSETIKKTIEQGAEVYNKAEQAATEAYAKTSEAMSKTYEQAERYAAEHPGKAVLIALGIGVGLGIILCATSRPGRTSRIAQPIMTAVTDIAGEFFR